MTLEQLRIFVEAARYGSFTLAAGKLGLTQAAISISIRKLEERHDVTLFTRAGNGLLVTEAGRILLTEAERILRDVELTIKRVESYRDVQNRRTILACSRNAYDYWMPGILAKIGGQPHIGPIDLVVGSADDVTAWVMRGTADVGISENLPGHTQFRYWDVFSDTLSLCATTAFAAGLSAALSWTNLDEGMPIIWEAETDLEKFVVSAITSNKLNVKRIRHDGFRLTSTAAVLSSVESGRFAGFLTHGIARNRLQSGDLIKLGACDIAIKYWLFASRHREVEHLAAEVQAAAETISLSVQ